MNCPLSGRCNDVLFSFFLSFFLLFSPLPSPPLPPLRCIYLSLIRFPSYRSICLSPSISVTCVHLLSLSIYRCIFCLPSFSFSVFTQSPLSFYLSLSLFLPSSFAVCLPSSFLFISFLLSMYHITLMYDLVKRYVYVCTNVHSKRINMKTCACVYDVLCCTVRLVKRVPRVVCTPDFFVVKI